MKTKDRKRWKMEGCNKKLDPSKIGLLQFSLLESEEILCCTECSLIWMEERRKLRQFSSVRGVR